MSVLRTRRAQLDEAVKDKIRQRVKELMDEKSGGSGEDEEAKPDAEDSEEEPKEAPAEGSEDAEKAPEDGEEVPAANGMPGGELLSLLFGDEEVPEGNAKSASVRKADIFPTEKALEKYLKQHPDADRSNHRVEEKFHTPSKEESETKGRPKGKPETDGESKGKKPEEKPGKVPVKPEEPSGDGEGTKDLKKDPEGKKAPQKPSEKAPEKAPEKDEKAEKPKKEKKPAEKVVSKYFSDEEMSMPEDVTQKFDTKDELYKQATEAQEQMMEWLDRGKGIDKKLGAKHFDLAKDKDTPVDLDSRGPILITAGIKSEGRATEKVNRDYKGHWNRIGDLVRASIAVDTGDEIEGVMKALRDSGMKLARQPKDRFAKPTLVNYRDILMNVTYPNGHVGELQVHVKNMIKAKGKAHDLYATVGHIEAEAKKENRTTMTDEEKRTIDHANNLMRAIYDDAWSKSQMRTAASFQAGGGSKYVNYNGNPARWRYKEFPVVWRDGKQHVVYDIFHFVHESHEIERDEFEEMLKKQDSKRTSSLSATVVAKILGDRVASAFEAVKGMQLVRKNRDVMQDTGGRSKGRGPDPEIKPSRSDVRKPWRTKSKEGPEKEQDTDRDSDMKGDKDMRLSFDFASLARRELARWPMRFLDMIG